MKRHLWNHPKGRNARVHNWRERKLAEGEEEEDVFVAEQK